MEALVMEGIYLSSGAHFVAVKTSPDLPHIPVQHSAWVEGGEAAAVRRLLGRVQFERLGRTACTQRRRGVGWDAEL